MQEPLNFKLMLVTPLPISEVSPAPETLMLQTVQLEEISFKRAQFYYSQQQKYNSSHNFLSVNTVKRELLLFTAVTAKTKQESYQEDSHVCPW